MMGFHKERTGILYRCNITFNFLHRTFFQKPLTYGSPSKNALYSIELLKDKAIFILRQACSVDMYLSTIWDYRGEKVQMHTCGIHTYSPCYYTERKAHKRTDTSINFFSLSRSNTHIPTHIPQTHPVFNHNVMANYSEYSLCWKGQLHPQAQDS